MSVASPVPRLVTYGCGSPVRLPMMEALAKGSGSDRYLPEPDPQYQGGHSIVWGLIRGAPQVMQQTRAAGFDFYQVDNAYFGRNQLYRVTRNALQLTQMGDREPTRFEATFRALGLTLRPWQRQRNGPIVICLSTPFLFTLYGMEIQRWTDEVVARIRQKTDRPIHIRGKDDTVPIDQMIADAWCVVTHVSASALDALRLGIPTVTTGDCAATPLATPLDEIDNPRMPDGRERLFATLAYGQFTVQEMQSGVAWRIVSQK
jgi:hypothetical protein